MFINFLQFLRQNGLAVSVGEWMTLMDGLARGLADCSLLGFYELCRCICIKREDHLDLYDQCFAAFFHNIEPHVSLHDDLLKWLENPIAPKELSAEDKAKFKTLDFEALKKQFEERLKEQKERHDGGSKWIGTGGTSPFGHSGYHPEGIRVGGESWNKSAVQIASQRRFQNLRHDLVLDTRQISVALRKLRKLSNDSQREELDLEKTIRKTGDNAGDISLVFRKEKRNSIKLLLLMDIGGSMTSHSFISERLFSAAYASRHFRHFKYYFFHNCPYETLFTDVALGEGIATNDVMQKLDPSWKVIVVGDAAMSPYELTMPGGSVDWYHHNEDAGIVWLRRLKEHFKRSVWLNPEPEEYWNIASNRMVRQVYPMFPLSIEGIEMAVEHLRR
ncbi:MAG: VWA domain-containing protein [Bdellovibrionota bacterium]